MSFLFVPIYIALFGLPIFLFIGVAMLVLELVTLAREGKENGEI
jgi:hypothetical protein